MVKTQPLLIDDPPRKNTMDETPPPPGRYRFVIYFMLWSCLVVAYGLRVVMSSAAISISSEFGYNNAEKGTLLSAFFWGYIVLQIPSGHIATKRGGWPVMGLGVFFASVFTALIPFVASSYSGLLIVRALSGLPQGLLYPSVHALAAKWAPKAERSTVIGLAWSGAFISTAITLPISGWLINGAGWRWCFYLSGLVGVLWCGLWFILGASGPESHSWVSRQERTFIRLGQREHAEPDAPVPTEAGDDEGDGTAPVKRPDVPWRVLLTHPAVVAILCSHFGHNYSFYFLLTWLPTYLHDELGFDIEQSTGIAVAPYIACFVVSVLSGLISDVFIRRGVKVLTVRKISQTIAEVIPSVAIVIVGFISNTTLSVIVLTIAVGASGACSAGFATSHLDIAPQYGGLLLGFSNCLATVAGIVAPILVGAIVNPPNDDAAHWRIAFFVSAAVTLTMWGVFMVLARGTKQPMLDPDSAMYDDAAAAGATAARQLKERGKGVDSATAVVVSVKGKKIKRGALGQDGDLESETAPLGKAT